MLINLVVIESIVRSQPSVRVHYLSLVSAGILREPRCDHPCYIKLDVYRQGGCRLQLEYQRKG
jgi:hypothetical protein